jgi:hypothetical protein
MEIGGTYECPCRTARWTLRRWHGHTHPRRWGLGVDSVAMLLRWIVEPASGDFDLSELAGAPAHTNDEWGSTLRDVETFVSPMLAQTQVRFIKVTRDRLHTTKTGTGITALTDSRSPALHAG